ncbi:carbon-nitrogen hydrolase family protein [Nocardioides mangrovicus]|uniref:Carbon-nitrogen hydrolase family protein n=1 Tax=Nocardioides mangrovicus TaxID=2478913 RepID=A0A3L8P654_9ACTN|nr:carbon-nitrogen hydrolase family protein [Nocardioides mangrovicus]RLV50554.1 carbon-nitrogen hydrolase family protein [Nocardioides mangrovicus]
MRIAVAAAHFGRDLDRCLTKVEGIVGDAESAGADLLVLPDAALGGYLGDLQDPDAADVPPALDPDGPEVRRLIARAGSLVVCVGLTEADGERRHNAALCLSGDGVLGRHRKVHLPAGEASVFTPGSRFDAFDTPLGRMGMLIDYDKTFPESARSLALDGADVIACLSAWPASVTDRSRRLPQDRQARLFDLYDCARAAENQVVVASANQTGSYGRLRFLGLAKVVGPGGDVLARTSSKGGLAVADVDVAAETSRARRMLNHLKEIAPTAYQDRLR